MKPFNFAMFLAFGTVAMAMPAAAQMSTNASPYEFLNAVRDRDGNKAAQMLSESPTGFIDSRDAARELLATAKQAPDYREGVRSFIERRPPRFAGLGAVGSA